MRAAALFPTVRPEATAPVPRTRANAWAAATLVALLAAANFLVGLDRFQGLIWDEGYYITSSQRYENGRAQFGTHPPLGLMLLAAGDTMARGDAVSHTSHLGSTKHAVGEMLPPGYSPYGMRVASALAAALAASAFFGLLLSATRSLTTALVGANLYVFDNALIAHFRAAHLDAFQLLFAILALWAFVSAATRPYRAGWREAAIGGFGALAMLVKLNAAWLLVPAVLLVALRARQRCVAGPAAAFGAAATTAARMLVAGTLATVMVLTAHVAVGHEPPDTTTIAGRQDAAFVDGAYRDYLHGERRLTPAVLIDAGIDYARFMAADAEGMGLHDSNGSTPIEWLFLRRTINYRWDSANGETAYVQLVPNPLGWALALLAPFAAVAMLWLSWRRTLAVGWPPHAFLLAATLAAWFACFALHGWISAQRVMYLYHAFGGVLLAFLLAAMTWAAALERWPTLRERRAPPMTAFVAFHLAAFLWFSPLSFHRPLTYDACEARNVPLRVVECRP